MSGLLHAKLGLPRSCVQKVAFPILPGIYVPFGTWKRKRASAPFHPIPVLTDVEFSPMILADDDDFMVWDHRVAVWRPHVFSMYDYSTIAFKESVLVCRKPRTVCANRPTGDPKQFLPIWQTANGIRMMLDGNLACKNEDRRMQQLLVGHRFLHILLFGRSLCSALRAPCTIPLASTTNSPVFR